ncbi:methyltransferase [Abeliophyllum distichum]|uniref:tRNA:m(4)X modification enzyme TRM13 n=1 Tax=Abeliophyllum distichum TaxID=126358 RepID=A0ABD1REV5_9LAMI
MGSHCKFWLPKKNRFCANSPFNNSSFCGNHTQRSDGRWIPCPIDPTHSVLEENLEGHLNRCPLLKQAQSLSRQPYYQKGVNAGHDDDDEEEEEEEEEEEKNLQSSGVKDSSVTSEMKRNAVYAMTVTEFSKLIARIKSVHATVCNDIRDSFKILETCSIWTNREVDKKLPYQERHVLQQASILGNLEEFGVLKKSCASSNVASKHCDSNGESENYNDVPAVVEFGAGRGYLTQMLADCYGIKKVLLVERKSYKLKADRSLRQKELLTLERLRIDIEDLNLNGVEPLQGVAYMAIGKHLCGPATDMTLRCCIGEQSYQDIAAEAQASCYFRGLAIATCCHHLCQWKKLYNWAVDADHGSIFTSKDCMTQYETMSEMKQFGSDSEVRGVGEIVSDMQPIDRAVLGFMCKDIIDTGRLMWVKAQGLESQLVKYVPCSISPENHLLVARYKKRS